MRRVMLVDDDRELAELFAGQLTRAGYEVRFADSLRDAVRVASAEPPFDALITDLHLPDGDGAQVAAALRVPVNLALTGSSSPTDSQRLLAAGFAEVLVKPLVGNQLVAALMRNLEVPK